MLITPPALRPYSASKFDSTRSSATASSGRIVAGVPNTPASLIAGSFRYPSFISVPASKKLFERPRAPFTERSRRIRNLVRRSRHARHQKDQLLIIAPVHRQIRNDFRLNNPAQSVVRRFHLRQRISQDLHALRHFARLQRKVRAPLARNFHHDPRYHRRLESAVLHGRAVISDRQLRHRVRPVGARRHHARQSGIKILHRDVRPAHRHNHPPLRTSLFMESPSRTLSSLQSFVALHLIALQAGTNAKFGNLATFAPQQCRLTPQPTLQFALRFGPQDFSGAPLARTPVGTTRHCHYPKH